MDELLSWLRWQSILNPVKSRIELFGEYTTIYYIHINQSGSWSFSSIAPCHDIILIATLISERFMASFSERIIGSLLERSNPLGSAKLS